MVQGGLGLHGSGHILDGDSVGVHRIVDESVLDACHHGRELTAWHCLRVHGIQVSELGQDTGIGEPSEYRFAISILAVEACFESVA